ncbi:MAG: ECF transporter S component [Firmicutes bacterium]|nr:ECF transporter S component [Bacillota bacterium]
MKNKTVKELVQMAMLVALSIVLVYMVRFPIFPAAPFLEYDMADVPILIGTFLFGPLSGLLLTIAVSIVQGLTVSVQSGWVGIVMHAFATGSFVLVAGTLYRYKHDRLGAVIALICGSIVMTLMMIPLNLVFTVYFMGATREMVVSMLVPIIIPFNLIKAGANSVITFLVYKSVARVLRLEKEEKVVVQTR